MGNVEQRIAGRNTVGKIKRENSPPNRRTVSVETNECAFTDRDIRMLFKYMVYDRSWVLLNHPCIVSRESQRAVSEKIIVRKMVALS